MPLIMNAEVDKLDGLAPRASEHCHRQGDVMRCAACQAVYYCGRTCQAADRNDHKFPCKAIKKARLQYEHEEHRLKNMPGDYRTPERIFETQLGRFGVFLATRPYMDARYSYVDTLLLCYGTAGGPVDVVQTALDHFYDMLVKDRSDSSGMGNIIPSLYIRLGRDQDAYNFVKWHTVTSKDEDYDHGDISIPHIDIEKADMFESLDMEWLDDYLMELGPVVNVALINVRILLYLQTMQNAGIALRGILPAEIRDLIRGQLVGSVMPSRPNLLLSKPAETAQLADEIRGQIRALYRAVQRSNAYFWKLLVEEPDTCVLQRPSETEACLPGSRDAALVTLRYTYAAWYETPGAVRVLRSLAKINPK